MIEETISDRLRKMTLLQPETQSTLARPVVKSISCELELGRKTAERMFKTLVFEPDEETVTIMEVLRPAAPGEPHVFFHSGAGIGFCVDHYELDGVRL